MTPEVVFQYCSTLALVGWVLLLLFSPFWFNTDKLLIGIIISILAIVYAWLIFSHFRFSNMGDFGSLDGVMNLFQDKALVTAGWVHYLAFDLLAGTWIKRNAMKHGICHWILVPCLLLTFMLGPVGLLLYLLVRTFKTQRYFAENF